MILVLACHPARATYRGEFTSHVLALEYEEHFLSRGYAVVVLYALN